MLAATILASCLMSLGCGQQAATAPPTTSAVDARFILAAEPAQAIGVVDFKEQASSGETFSVVGRIGGGVEPWIEGRSAFLLVDTGAPLPCADDECGPECQHCAQEIAESTTVVKFVDAHGKTLPVDARELLGVKEEETVVVQGIAKRDEAGNVALMASGIYIKR
jgi:hypothetical protein